jgi:protein-tyrosine phosphatase
VIALLDVHSHVVPGVDDGAESLEHTRAMLAAMHGAGTRQLWATPHIADCYEYPASAERLRLIDEQFQALLAIVPDGLTVRLGYEVTPSEERLASGADVAGFALPDLDIVLIDGPDDEPCEHEELILPYIARVRAEGLRAVLAHPERRAAHPEPDPGFAERAVQAGALLQIDACALLGGDGPAVGAEAWRLLTGGIASLVASDAHAQADASDLGAAHAAIAERIDARTADRLCGGLELSAITTP